MSSSPATASVQLFGWQLVSVAVPQPVWRLYGAQGSELLDSDPDLEALLLRSGRRNWLVWTDAAHALGKVQFTSSALETLVSSPQLPPEYAQYTVKQELVCP